MNRPTVALPPRFTFEEFCSLVREDQKADLIDGVIYMASPEGTAGNELEGWLHALILCFVKRHKLGRVYVSRVAFRLDERNAPEPDIAFVGEDRAADVKEGHVDGPPDLAVEVVSPESVYRDYELKLPKYEAAGVQEYWIVDRLKQKVSVFHLDRNGKYKPIRIRKGALHSRVLPGFWVRPEWLWQGPQPDPVAILQEILAGHE